VEEPTPAPPTGREANGRFGAGNAGGPGRPKGRTDELQRAAQAAVTAEHIGAIMRRAVRSALEGNLNAAKLVLDRACGKARDAAGEAVPLDLDLPSLRTAANCAAAIDRIAAAITAGTVEPTAAKLLLEVVQTRLKAIEVQDLESRLTELESMAKSVDLKARR
jgi:hypothetical protein